MRRRWDGLNRHGIKDPKEDTDYWLEGNDNRFNFDVNTPSGEQSLSPGIPSSCQIG